MYIAVSKPAGRVHSLCYYEGVETCNCIHVLIYTKGWAWGLGFRVEKSNFIHVSIYTGGQSSEVTAAVGWGSQSPTAGRGREPGPGGEGSQRKDQPHPPLPAARGGGATAQRRPYQSERPAPGVIKVTGVTLRECVCGN